MSDKSFSATPPARDADPGPGHGPAPASSVSVSAPGFFDLPVNNSIHNHRQSGFDPADTNLRPSLSDVAAAVSLYFHYCHRQPIWCFERDQVSDYARIPEELACSILALTSRFSDSRGRGQLHGDNAKTLVMLRIANGSVEVTTMESLCLLAYSSFMGIFSGFFFSTKYLVC